MARTPSRPLWLALAVAGLAPAALADGALVEVQETIVTSAHTDPFGPTRYARRPFGYGGNGVGLGVGVRRGHVGVGAGFGYDRYDPHQVDAFALERALADEVRARRASLAAQAERRGGLLLAFQEGRRELDHRGWRVRAATQVRAYLVLPEAQALALGARPVRRHLRLALALRGQAGTVSVPVALEEVARLRRSAKGERDTVLGALLRGAWAEAGGKKSSKGKVQVLVSDAQGALLGGVDGPSIDPLTGRRGFFSRLWAKLTRKKDADLPALDGSRVHRLGGELVGAEALDQAGLGAELDRQVALRRGPVSALPAQAGVIDSLGR